MATGEAAPATAGCTNGWARSYDALVANLTRGRALRAATGELARIAPVLLAHHRRRVGVQDLPAPMEAAGFTGVETRETGFGPLGVVRGWVRG